MGVWYCCGTGMAVTCAIAAFNVYTLKPNVSEMSLIELTF